MFKFLFQIGVQLTQTSLKLVTGEPVACWSNVDAAVGWNVDWESRLGVDRTRSANPLNMWGTVAASVSVEENPANRMECFTTL